MISSEFNIEADTFNRDGPDRGDLASISLALSSFVELTRDHGGFEADVPILISSDNVGKYDVVVAVSVLHAPDFASDGQVNRRGLT